MLKTLFLSHNVNILVPIKFGSVTVKKENKKMKVLDWLGLLH